MAKKAIRSCPLKLLQFGIVAVNLVGGEVSQSTDIHGHKQSGNVYPQGSHLQLLNQLRLVQSMGLVSYQPERYLSCRMLINHQSQLKQDIYIESQIDKKSCQVVALKANPACHSSSKSSLQVKFRDVHISRIKNTKEHNGYVKENYSILP